MLVNHHPAGLQVHIVHGLASDEVIVFNLAVVKAVISMQISFTYPKQVRMMIRNDIFNLICFVFQESRPSIPVAKFDPSVASVTICVSGIKIAIRQDGILEGLSSNYPASVQVDSLNTSQSSSRVYSRDIMVAEVEDSGESSRNVTTKYEEGHWLSGNGKRTIIIVSIRIDSIL